MQRRWVSIRQIIYPHRIINDEDLSTGSRLVVASLIVAMLVCLAPIAWGAVLHNDAGVKRQIFTATLLFSGGVLEDGRKHFPCEIIITFYMHIDCRKNAALRSFSFNRG